MYLNDAIDKYIEKHTSPEPPVLSELSRETHLKVLNPRMLSGNVQGRFLSLISQIIQPLNILEIGTFTGYSAICLAEGLREGGCLCTIDINDELEDIVNKYIEKSGMQSEIRYITGDAREIIQKLDKMFDLVFIDAEKREYSEYFNLVKNKMNIGAVLLADNVLWNGKVVDSQEINDPATLAILDFNKKIRNDDDFEVTIIPIRDGITMARKIK